MNTNTNKRRIKNLSARVDHACGMARIMQKTARSARKDAKEKVSGGSMSAGYSAPRIDRIADGINQVRAMVAYLQGQDGLTSVDWLAIANALHCLKEADLELRDAVRILQVTRIPLRWRIRYAVTLRWDAARRRIESLRERFTTQPPLYTGTGK